MEGRRRITLYDQLTAGDTSRRDSLAALILNDVVLATNQESETATGRSRTLLDIIKEDESNNNNNRRSWKAFKDKLRLNRTGAGSVWTSTSTTTTQNNNNNNNTTSLSQFLEQQNDVVGEDPDNAAPITREPSSRGGDNDSAGPVSMLLMDLLEETTDHETELQVSSYKISDDDDEEKYCGEEEWGVVGNNCCVCMVRHKGAAFIPCGHTFCRMCCREIWVSRGNCPLCNNFILEILDIF